MKEQEPLLSIGDHGIKINLQKEDLIVVEADEVSMHGVQHKVDGGIAQYNVSNGLVQTGNSMEVNNGGHIINRVITGTLEQNTNSMKAVNGGIIENSAMPSDAPSVTKPSSNVVNSFIAMNGHGNVVRDNSFQLGENNTLNKVDKKSPFFFIRIFLLIVALVIMFLVLHIPISFNF